MNEYDIRFKHYNKNSDFFVFEVFGCSAIELSTWMPKLKGEKSLGVTEIGYDRSNDTMWLKMPMANNGDYGTTTYQNQELKSIIVKQIDKLESMVA